MGVDVLVLTKRFSITKSKAYGTTDMRLVESDRRSYVLQFGHVIDNPTSWDCYCGGSRQWHCSQYFLIS